MTARAKRPPQASQLSEGSTGRVQSALCARLRSCSRHYPILTLLLLIGLAGVLTGCGDDEIFSRFKLKPDPVIVERSPDPAYEKLFPYYVDLCTVSQTARIDGSRGNPFGHAAMYIKGACKDEAAPFPQLRRCRRMATDVEDPEHGAGVSVNRFFRNVNWVAVPGYQLFFGGNLKPGQRLTEAHVNATVQTALDRGVFDGVELQGSWTNKNEWTLRDFIARRSITTDFALQFARNVFCARVPVTEPVLDEVIAFYNDKNYEYATGKADYNWNLIADNCVHTVRNALAAANFWSPISVRQVKLLHLLHLAVPAHEFVNLAVLGSEGPLDDYRQVYRDDALRDALNDFKWLPTRHGALVKTLPVHEPNDIFRTDFRLFTVQSPIRMGKTRQAIRLLSEERNVELEANLQYYLIATTLFLRSTKTASMVLLPFAVTHSGASAASTMTTFRSSATTRKRRSLNLPRFSRSLWANRWHMASRVRAEPREPMLAAIPFVQLGADRPLKTMRYWALLLPLFGGLAACETAIDPSTGATQTRLTLPFTAANAERAEAQWRQCVQFRSESYCARNLPGGPPPAIASTVPMGDGELLQRDQDP